MNSPIGTPSHYMEKKEVRKNPREPTVEKYNPVFTGKVSIFEDQKPNKITRAVDPFEKVIGERPPVDFSVMYDYRDKTPQIDSIVEYCTDLIIGTDLNINTDEEFDSDGKWKQILEDFSSEVSLFEKVRGYTDDTLTTGTALIVRVFKAGKLENLEQFDMTSVKRVKRDEYGNVIDYMIDSGNGGEESLKKSGNITNINQVLIPLKFKQRGRDFFGRSVFHGLAVQRNVGNRTSRPVIESLWSLDDVVIGTLENFAFPREYHIFDGINTDDLELEAQKFKESKPGDVLFVNRMHEIDRREPTQARFDAFITHLSDVVQLGTGFPLEILLGDFTSRASSQTTDSLLMRRIKAFQKQLVKVLKTEVLETFLTFNYGIDDETIKKLNISIEFETNTPMEYTPDQVLSRFTAGAWTVNEVRNYDKNNGLDLFEDDEIKQQIEDKKEKEDMQFQSEIDDKKNQKDKDKQMKEALKATNMALLNETQRAREINDDVDWITVKGNHIPIKKGQSKGDAIDDFFKNKTNDEPKKDKPIDISLTQNDYKTIEDGLKKHFSVTKEPTNKVFLTSDGEWIQLRDGDEHFSVLSGVTDKYISTDKARKTPSNQFFAGGLVRMGFDKSVTFVNGNKPLNSRQIEVISLAMIKKGYNTDHLIIEFPDKEYEKKLFNLLKKQIGESYENTHDKNNCPICDEMKLVKSKESYKR